MTAFPAIDYEDFSGGMADINTPNDRRTGNIVQSLDLTLEKKLKGRNGSAILDSTSSLVSASTGGVRENGRTGSIINYQEDLHCVLRSKGALYAKNSASWDSGTAWTKLSSVNSGFEAIPSYRSLTALAALPDSEYLGHILLNGQDASYSTPEFVVPTKVFLDNTNTFQARNASLATPNDPTTLSDYTRIINKCCLLANDIKTQLNTHANTANIHTTTTTPVTAANATDEATLLTLTAQLVTKYNAHVQDSMGIASGIHRVIPLSSMLTTQTYPAAFHVCGSMAHPNIPELFDALDCIPILNKLRFGMNCHINAFMNLDQTMIDDGFFPQGVTVTFNTTSKTFTFSAATAAAQLAFSALLRTGDQIHFRGTMPTGLTAGTTYYIINSGGLKLASSFANAVAGTNIAFTGSPSGNTGFLHPQNLHGASTQHVTAPYVYSTPWIVTPGLPNGPASNNAGHISSLFWAEVNALQSQYLTHLSTTYHNHNAALGYMTDASTIVSAWGAGNDNPAFDDWDCYIAVLKIHYAYRLHRLEGITGEYHQSSTTDDAKTALVQGVSIYKQDFMPDIFDATTWNNLYLYIKDVMDHLGGANSFDSGGVATTDAHVASNTRHPAVPSILLTPIKLKYNYVNRRYAVVHKYKYTTYENKTFEDISAPIYTDSFALVTAALFEDNANFTNRIIRNYVGFPSTIVAQSQQGATLLEMQAIDNNPQASAITELYRTQDNGTVFYLCQSYSHADLTGLTYTPEDSTDTGILLEDQTLYTTGGTVANDPVPRSVSQVRLGDVTYLGGIVEETTPKVIQPSSYSGTSINLTAHGLSDGTAVVFWNQVTDTGTPMPQPILMGQVYFVVNASTNAFSVSATPGGSAITITASPNVGTVYCGAQRFTAYPKRIRQTLAGSTYASPSDFFADSDSDIIQMGSAQDYPIAVCKQGIYRVEGQFSEDGSGAMILKKISDRVGGVSAKGGITVNDIFYFMGFDGFYMTDGFKVIPLSGHLKEAHKTIVDQNVAGYSARNSQVGCTYDPVENRISWNVNSGNSDYSTEIWTLYLNLSESGRGSFSKHTGASTGFRPTAIGFFRNQLLRGDTQGFVFAHSASSPLNDPKIDRTSSGSLVSGVGTHIPYQYRSLAEDFGNRQLRKLIARMLIQLENTGNLTLAIGSINDKATAYMTSLSGVRFRQEYQGIIKEKRTFPVPTSQSSNFQGTRCFLKQIDLSPSIDILYRSDDYALCSNSSGTLTTASGSWPAPSGSVVDALIYFETDNYVTGYTISSVSGGSMVIASPPANFSGKKWVIKGHAKDERFWLQSYSLYHQQIVAQPMPPTGVSAGNA